MIAVAAETNLRSTPDASSDDPRFAVHSQLDCRGCSADLVVCDDAAITSCATTMLAGVVMLLREAVERSGFDWRAEAEGAAARRAARALRGSPGGVTMAAALHSVLHRTGRPATTRCGERCDIRCVRMEEAIEPCWPERRGAVDGEARGVGNATRCEDPVL